MNSNHRFDTDQGAFFVRIYEEQSPAGAELDLARTRDLHARGVPTPAPLGPLVLYAASAGAPDETQKAVAAFPWLEGDMICQAGVTAAHAREVGRALATLHSKTADMEIGPGRFTTGDVAKRLERIDAPPYGDARELLRGALEDHAARRDAGLPAGLIHGDLFRDNVLWKGDRVEALLDFESASRGPYAYDLAVAICAWCYGDAFDPELVRATIEGYGEVRALSPRERAGLHAEACVACVRFATTRITDFAMRSGEARAIKDYRRFLARLAELESKGTL